MITDLINKIFMILMGLMLILILYSIFNSINSTSCYPQELYQEEGMAGLGGGIFDKVYDSMCATVLDINNGLFEAFLNPAAEFSGVRSMMLSLSNGVWNMGKFFCKTHTNFDYTDQDGSEAITDPEHLLEIFLYEAERCWNLFEGVDLKGETASNRNPIANIGFFDCAEIIYDFPAGQNLSLKRIHERIREKNTCGAETNIPKDTKSDKSKYDSTTLYNLNDLYYGLYWCLPKDLMSDYWYKKDKVIYYYDNGCKQSEIGYDDITDSTYCFNNDVATCMLGKYPGYDNTGGVSVISGIGRIVISYFDFFNWQRYSSRSKMDSYDVYKSCDGVNVFDGMSEVGVYIRDEEYQNSLIVCYEKYDRPSEYCNGTVECNVDELSFGWYWGSDCDYATKCKDGGFWRCGNSGDNSCSSIPTEYKCASNTLAGCSWISSGYCAGSSNCGGCGTSLRSGNSACDRATLCHEEWDGVIHRCYSNSPGVNLPCNLIKSQYACQRNSCAGCSWVEI